MIARVGIGAAVTREARRDCMMGKESRGYDNKMDRRKRDFLSKS